MEQFIKLKKETFPKGFPERGVPSITISSFGKIYLNKSAVEFLSLIDKDGKYSGVSFSQNPKDKSEFSVCKDDNGWMLRWGAGEGAEFNNKNLACFIMDAVWEKHCKPAGGPAYSQPKVMHFRIAHLPVDDEVNKNNFVLILKKR